MGVGVARGDAAVAGPEAGVVLEVGVGLGFGLAGGDFAGHDGFCFWGAGFVLGGAGLEG